MSHDIFISYTEADRKIAEEVGRVIKIAFQGEILPYIAVHEIKAGDSWKSEIKKSLQKCKAIVSLITKNSINRPWIFIEWGAYWLEEKKFYILVTDDISLGDLVHPMQDVQVTLMSNIDSVKGLFLRLSQDANCKDVPFEKAKDFVVAIQSAVVSQESALQEKSFAKYSDELEKLPGEDSELEKISSYFYDKGDISNFKRIAILIKSDTLKAGIAFRLLRFNDYDNAYFMAIHIRSSQSQAAIAVHYIDSGYEDSPYVRNLVDEISSKSSSHLKEICFHLSEQGREDSAVFRHIISSMASMAELRKIATWFVDNDRYDSDIFLEIIDSLASNGAELRKVGILLAQHGHGNVTALKHAFKLLSKFHQKKLLEATEGLEIGADIINSYAPNKANAADAKSSAAD